MSSPEPLRLSLLHFRLKETTDEFIAAANGDGRVQQESHQLQSEYAEVEEEHETVMDQMDEDAAQSQSNGIAEPAQPQTQTQTLEQGKGQEHGESEVATANTEKASQGEEAHDMNLENAVAQDDASADAAAAKQSGEEAAPVPSPSAAQGEKAPSPGTNPAADTQQQEQQQQQATDTAQETQQDNVLQAASTQNSQGDGADGTDAQSALDKLLGSLENAGPELGPTSTEVSQPNDGGRHPSIEPALTGEADTNSNGPDSTAMDTQPSEGLAPPSETSSSQPASAQQTIKEEQPSQPAAVDYQSPLPSHLQSESNSPYPTNSGQAQTSAAPAVMSGIKANYGSPRPTGSSQLAAASHDRKPEALSRLAKLRQRVAKDKFDGEAWLQLIADASEKGDLERTREAYSGFLKNFPDNVRLLFSPRFALHVRYAPASAVSRKQETCLCSGALH